MRQKLNEETSPAVEHVKLAPVLSVMVIVVEVGHVIAKHPLMLLMVDLQIMMKHATTHPL